MSAVCPLCHPSAESVLWRDERLRVLIASEPGYPGFCRVVWNAHVQEMTDLAPLDRDHLMDLVFASEGALREVLRPIKMNLASLGNSVPHLHWHVIPRFAADPTYPDAVWAAARRPLETKAPRLSSAELAAALERALRGALRSRG